MIPHTASLAAHMAVMVPTVATVPTDSLAQEESASPATELWDTHQLEVLAP